MRVRLGGTVVDNSSARIYRRWGYTDVCCPQDVRDAVEQCPEGEELIFELNSGGGSVYQGFEMYSVIRGHKGPTTAEVLGIAGSAMSVVMSACDTVLMSPVANVMIHRASTYAHGNSRVMKETKQMLDTIDESILAAYTQKSKGKTERDAFARMMRNETFLTAQEAVNCGLADGVIQQQAEEGQPGDISALAVASMGSWAGMLELPPVDDLVRREQERDREIQAETEKKTDAGLEREPDNGNGQNAQGQAETEPVSQKGEQNKRSEPNMEFETKEQLAEQFPELTAQIAQEAARAERERIAGIDALAMPGFEELIRKAKEDPAQNAGTVAQAIVMAQKQSGAEALEKLRMDAEDSGVNQVPAASSESGADGGSEEESVEQAAKAAVEMWKQSGGMN